MRMVNALSALRVYSESRILCNKKQMPTLLLAANQRFSSSHRDFHSCRSLHQRLSTYSRNDDNTVQTNRAFFQPVALFSTSSSSSSESSLSPSSSHVKTYHLQGSTHPDTKSGVVVTTTNTGHTLQTDVPKAMGGKNVAPQPVELLMTALIGCTQATALFVGRNLQPERLLIEKIEFDLQAERDERGALSQIPININVAQEDALPSIPSRLQRVSGTVQVYAMKKKPISDSVLQALTEQTEARCPVANMMHASGTVMDIQWVDGNSASSSDATTADSTAL